MIFSVFSLFVLTLLGKANYPAQFYIPDATYVAESPLPEGWAKPTKYYQVTRKTLPAYTGCYTKSNSSGLAFFRLFRHIKKAGVPMTAPVEMKIQRRKDAVIMRSMGFLYPTIAKATGESKRVKNYTTPTKRVLSFIWQGSASIDSKRAAKEQLLNYARDYKLKLRNFRILGYNSPRISDRRKTWEIVADYSE